MRWMAMGFVALALAGCNRPQGGDSGPAPVVQEPPAYSDAEKAAILATFPAPFDKADLADGEKQFGRCRSCHTLAPGAGNMVGPPLFGVFGRTSGTLATYPFSDAMKAHDTVWDFQSLDVYLTAPQKVVKGTRMSLPGGGIDDAEKRRNLIAYLKLESTPRPAEAASADASSQ